MTPGVESVSQESAWYAPDFPNWRAFYARFFRELGHCRDTDGRPLADSHFRDAYPAEHRTCSYGGSRKGLLINRTALEQMSRQWLEFLGGLAHIRALVVERERLASDRGLSVFQIWRVASAVMFLPAYLLRTGAASDGSIPTVVSTLFRASLDIVTTLELWMLREGAAPDALDGPADPVMLVRFAESERFLVNGRFACAGSPRQIEETFRLLVQGGARRAASEFPLPSAQSGSMLEFARLMGRQYLVGLLYLFRMQHSMEGLFHLLLPLTGDRYRRPWDEGDVSAYERRRRFVQRLIDGVDGLDRVFGSLARLIERLGPWTDPNTAGLHMASHPRFGEAPGLAEQLRVLLSQGAAGEALPPRAVTGVASELVAYLAFERRIVSILVNVQAELGRLLAEYGGDERGRGDEYLAFLHFPDSPREAVARVLGLEIEVDREATRVRSGASLMTLAAGECGA